MHSSQIPYRRPAQIVETLSQHLRADGSSYLYCLDRAGSTPAFMAALVGELAMRPVQLGQVCWLSDLDWCSTAGFVASLVHRRDVAAPATCPPEAITCKSFRTDEPVDRARFDSAIETLGERLLRLKGRVNFGDACVFAEVVAGRLLVKPTQTTVGRNSEFTAIARQISQQDLADAFERAWLPA